MAKTKIGEDIRRAARRAHLSQAEVARQASVEYGWLRQVTSGRIEQPNAKWLQQVADVVGEDPDKWLAMTNQLDVVSQLREAPDRGGSAAPDLVAAIAAQTAAIDRQAESLDRLARAIEVGSARVLGGVEGQGKLLARLVDALSRGGTLDLDELELHGVPER